MILNFMMTDNYFFNEIKNQLENAKFLSNVTYEMSLDSLLDLKYLS